MNFEEVKGKTGKDKVTGFEGIVTAYCQYLHEPDVVLLESLDKNGNPESKWLSISRFELIG